MATQTALRLADYVVTEAGFGADLGAEKFRRYQVPQGRPGAGGGGDCRNGARTEVSRWRGSRRRG
ncbi:MAG: formate--tetrahydrofolate ligase [Steroidobacteraceae bacterium]